MPSKTIEDFAYQVRDYMRSAEVVTGKNLMSSDVYMLGTSDAELGDSTFTTAGAGVGFVAKLKQNTDYVISRVGGNRSRIALSVNVPAFGGTCNIINIDNDVTEKSFNSGSYNYVYIYASNTSATYETIQPMVCTDAEWIRSQTFEPYYVPVKDSKLSIKDQQVLGAWNLLPIKEVTAENNGITFTVNKDSNGNVLSITANGTANDDVTFRIPGGAGASVPDYENRFALPLGSYIFSGCPVNGSPSTYYMEIVKSVNSSLRNLPYDDFGDGVSFVCDADTNRFDAYIRIKSGVTVSNLPFYPMISTQKAPYVPYAMTNRELTEVVEHTLTPNSKLNVSNVKCISCGRIHSLTFLATATQSIGQDESLFTGTIPYGSTPYYFFKTVYGDKMCEIQNDKIVLKSTAAANDVIRGSATWIY